MLYLQIVFELNKADPEDSQQLISPYLIKEIHLPLHYLIEYLHCYTIFTQEGAFRESYLEENNQNKPGQVNYVSNYDWKDLFYKDYVIV